eukprot:gene4667-5276_t
MEGREELLWKAKESKKMIDNQHYHHHHSDEESEATRTTSCFCLLSMRGRKKAANQLQHQAEADAFRITRGLDKSSQGTVSFLFGDSAWYLRAKSTECTIEPKRVLKHVGECSFLPMVDLWFPGFVAFESVEKPAHYLRLKNDGCLILDHYVGTLTFKQEASFYLKKKCRPGPSQSHGSTAWSRNVHEAGNLFRFQPRRYFSSNAIYQQLKPNSTLTLNNGVLIPRIGLGVYKSSPGSETRKAVQCALQNNYHMIDTAAKYANEGDVGEALRRENVPRESVFIVTKVWDDMHGYEKTIQSLKSSIQELQTNYVDLYLIHSPVGGKIVETWQAMVDLMEQGYTRAIGVSNFDIHHLLSLSRYSPVTPAVNQIEVHPFHQERAVVHYCKRHGIAVMAYSPLTRGQKMRHPLIQYLAYKHNKTPANILVRWCLQTDLICIPKSVKQEHIRENVNVFDFHLDDDDMRRLNLLEQNYRTGTNRMKEYWVPF